MQIRAFSVCRQMIFICYQMRSCSPKFLHGFLNYFIFYSQMQDHDSFVNSSIAPESPFLNQVMKKLSEKRGKLYFFFIHQNKEANYN